MYVVHVYRLEDEVFHGFEEMEIDREDIIDLISQAAERENPEAIFYFPEGFDINTAIGALRNRV